MRRVFAAAILQVVILLVLAAGGVGEAHAQGFFDSLFGGGQSRPAEAPQQPMSMPPPSYGHRAPAYVPNRDNDRSEREDDSSQKRSTGRYRTLCVRMCDGYYFPVSNSTNRNGFYKDAKICRASCGEEAKLFYLDKSETDIRSMVDVSGRAYAKLSSAFLYRKRLVDGCKCKPDPWSQGELDRHRSYALNETGDGKNGGVESVKKKVLAGPSDPAVRAVFERQEAGKAVAAAAPVAEPMERPGAAGEAANQAGEAESGGVNDKVADGASADAPGQLAGNGEFSKRKPDAISKAKPSSKPAERPAPTNAAAKPIVAPVRAAAPAAAPQPPFGLGAGQKLRWPGE